MKELLVISTLFIIAGCTVNLQVVNEFAGQKGNGTIKEQARTDEITTPTVDVEAEIKQEGL